MATITAIRHGAVVNFDHDLRHILFLHRVAASTQLVQDGFHVIWQTRSFNMVLASSASAAESQKTVESR